MRETKLFDFATAHDLTHFPPVDIATSAPLLGSPPFPCGTWAGLVGGTTAWRVHNGAALIFENILDRSGLRLNFSAPLTCRPLLRDGRNEHGSFTDLVLSVYASATSCTLLRLRAFVTAADPACEEVARLSMRSAFPTCMAEVDGDVVLGLSDGTCAKVMHADGTTPTIRIAHFLANPTVRAEPRAHGDGMSLVSGVSDETGGRSRRSVASSMSFGLMNRLFGSPRAGNSGAPPHAIEASSQEHGSVVPFGRRRREERAVQKMPRDPVLAVAKLTLDTKALACLHESGSVCAYVSKEETYQYAGEIVLPIEMSTSMTDQFLVTGWAESVIAVVVADEDPEADSLCVYNVTGKLRPDRSVAMSCTRLARRGGPIDRIVSAAFTGDDVVVGSETGFVSGVLNVRSESGMGVGIPQGTLWTAMDDVDQSGGLGNVLDEAFPSPADQLLLAHRFSTLCVAKALRLDNHAFLSRFEVEKAVRSVEFEDDADNMWARVKARAEQITKTEELVVRDISLVQGVGIVIARNKALYVLRSLLEPELKSLPIQTHLMNDRIPVSRADACFLLASHGICQVVASQFALEKGRSQGRSRLAFMLKMATAFSGTRTNLPLTDLVAHIAISRMKEPGLQVLELPIALSQFASTVEPGPKLLRFLENTSEARLLVQAAEQTADNLPISSMFASGLSWLAQFQATSRSAVEEEDTPMAAVEEGEEGPEAPGVLLERAYGCMLTASEWCSSREVLSDDDVQSVIGLAGLSGTPSGFSSPEDNDRVAMSVDRRKNPNDPDERGLKDHLDFWLLERSVRLLENSGASNSAAAAALAAMVRAPDRQLHEMMRAAAFSRFLDAGQLEHALRAILSEPHISPDDTIPISLQEGGALRDAIGLFVNAAADRRMLQWLSDSKLPEPLHVLCGLALERRARAADVLPILHLVHSKNVANALREIDAVVAPKEQTSEVVEYEQLYSWHILRGDEASAATSALEWAERLSVEGLITVKTLATTHASQMLPDQKVELLHSWTKFKSQAYSYASAAAELQRSDMLYVVRSRLCLLVDQPTSRRGIVNLSWVNRRHLLAHAQSRYLTIMLSTEDTDGTWGRTIQYLLGQDSSLLGEQKHGVGWVISALAAFPTYDNILLCTELASAWKEEVGDGMLMEIVQTAARIAAQRSITTFNYSELDNLLRALVPVETSDETSRNWNLLALESALSTSAGAVASPQWLIDAAAWGTAAFSEGTTSAERSFAGRKCGDASGVVRALLRNHRPVDAAKVLLVGLANQKITRQGRRKEPYYVPYSAIDSTVEMLAQVSDDYPDAEIYRKRLEEHTVEHISKMENMLSGSAQPVEMMAS